MEINIKAANKGQALETLCGCLGIAQEETVAFGDHSNDITMLKAAGLSVAMGNATEEAKASADRIAPSNDEDGVARVLEELLG